MFAVAAFAMDVLNGRVFATRRMVLTAWYFLVLCCCLSVFIVVSFSVSPSLFLSFSPSLPRKSVSHSLAFRHGQISSMIVNSQKRKKTELKPPRKPFCVCLFWGVAGPPNHHRLVTEKCHAITQVYDLLFDAFSSLSCHCVSHLPWPQILKKTEPNAQ